MREIFRSRGKLNKVTTAGLILAASLTTQEQTANAASEVTACGPNVIPRLPEEFLCKDRRIGTLGIVVLPGLTEKDPLIDLKSPSVQKVADYAADTLREASDGKILLKPKIIYAPSKITEEIKRRNKGGKCVDAGDGTEAQMGDIVKKFMPETKAYAQVVTLGGDACGKTVAVSGFEPTWRYIDVYNSDAKNMISPFPGGNAITSLGGTIAHEVEHHLGLGHAGTLTSTDAAALINKKSVFQEYDDFGNLMSKRPYPISEKGLYKPEDWTNPLQEQYQELHSGENEKVITWIMKPSEQITLRKNAENSPQAISFSLPEPISLAMPEDEPQEFTNVAFEPLYADGKASVIMYVSGQNGALLVTAKVGTFTIPKNKPVSFSTESVKLTAERSEDNDQMTFKLTERK